MDNYYSRITLKKQWFVCSKLHPIETAYQIDKELGKGAFGKVFRARSLHTGDVYAIKQIQKSRLVDEDDSFVKEMKILRALDHPNIIKIQETYETDLMCSIVGEFCEGGNLFEKILRERQMSENYAADIMRKLFSAIAYCHSNGVCHRDLKPENILFLCNSPNSDIKLIDFGLASTFSDKEIMRSQNGTPFYIAPEVLEGSYSKEIDCWSLGVILYIILSGTLPFSGDTVNEVFMKISNGSFSLAVPQFENVSPYAKDLIARLLIKQPDLRISAEQALQHYWISRHAPLLIQPLSEEIYCKIDCFMTSQKLKRATFMYIAVRVRENEIEDLKRTFENMDQDRNGVISRMEFEDCLVCSNIIIDDSYLENLWSVIDTNENNQIDYIEFISSLLDYWIYSNLSYLKSAFEFFDIDKSGTITVDEVRGTLHAIDHGMSEEDAMNIIKEADYDENGVIDYNEFLNMMLNNQNS